MSVNSSSPWSCPSRTAQTTLKAVERVREHLIIIQAMRPKPLFTCSFGLAHSAMSPGIDGVIALAATALGPRSEKAAIESYSRVGTIDGHPSGSGGLN